MLLKTLSFFNDLTLQFSVFFSAVIHSLSHFAPPILVNHFGSKILAVSVVSPSAFLLPRPCVVDFTAASFSLLIA